MTGIRAFVMLAFICSDIPRVMAVGPPSYGNPFCSWPSNIQKYKFYNDALMLTLSSVNAYTIELDGVAGSKLTCVARSGQFILRQGEDGQYKCVHLIDVCKDAFVVIETAAFAMDTTPALCDVCTAERLTSKPEVWVAQSKTTLECNLPKNCKCDDSSAIPCTGCENNIPDDGNIYYVPEQYYYPEKYYGSEHYANEEYEV